jgi:hypothetical protein
MKGITQIKHVSKQVLGQRLLPFSLKSFIIPSTVFKKINTKINKTVILSAVV